ncbi:hypothetical protein DSYM_07640 [Candidatus Desulfobacillus denitrificans]|uniref:Uncharacterized protein n=1 Tax=Candidatus Desulfobacillus denitrificans TaxID=2608985 RepID=A0A809R6W0_9PROT|nr:hypothetical protein DSYM_07640 [Candidatus Desulfobacillus denitrificans]
MFAGRIIHGDDQVPLLTGNPFMPAAVLVDHHAHDRAAHPPLAVRAALLHPGYQIRFLQTLLDPAVAPLAAAAPVPAVEVLDVPALVPVSVAIDQGSHLVGRRASAQSLPQPLVDQTLQPFRFVANQMPPKTALAHAQHLRRFRLAQPPPVPSLIRFFEPHLPDLL